MTVFECLALPFIVLWEDWKYVRRQRRLAALPEPTRTFTELVEMIERPRFGTLQDIKDSLDRLVHEKHIAYSADDVEPVIKALSVYDPEWADQLLKFLELRANPPPAPPLRTFWLSWRHDPGDGSFSLKSPWWSAGAQGERELIRAAVRAYSEEAAKCKVLGSYDWVQKEYRSRDGFGLGFVSWRPFDLGLIEWDSCEERPDDWTPWSEKFPREDWMEW